MKESLLSPMQFILHPLQSMATVLRSLSTGLPASKLAEYDLELIELAKNGKTKLYGSADEALDDILGKNVRARNATKGQETNCEALSA